MALQSGTYIITTRAGSFSVGRLLAEDRSLNPKRVVTLPKGVEAPKWNFERVANGNYILKIRGAYTAEINKLLFAILLNSPEPAEWKIVPQFHQGENTYTIVLANRPGDGWIAGDEGEQQIAIGPLPFGRTNPPTYFPSVLFVITPAE